MFFHLKIKNLSLFLILSFGVLYLSTLIHLGCGGGGMTSPFPITTCIEKTYSSVSAVPAADIPKLNFCCATLNPGGGPGAPAAGTPGSVGIVMQGVNTLASTLTQAMPWGTFQTNILNDATALCSCVPTHCSSQSNIAAAAATASYADGALNVAFQELTGSSNVVSNVGPSGTPTGGSSSWIGGSLGGAAVLANSVALSASFSSSDNSGNNTDSTQAFSFSGPTRGVGGGGNSALSSANSLILNSSTQSSQSIQDASTSAASAQIGITGGSGTNGGGGASVRGGVAGALYDLSKSLSNSTATILNFGRDVASVSQDLARIGEDPTDYLSRISPNTSLFQVVEKRYQWASKKWGLENL